jgi:hypothetical protein
LFFKGEKNQTVKDSSAHLQHFTLCLTHLVASIFLNMKRHGEKCYEYDYGAFHGPLSLSLNASNEKFSQIVRQKDDV